jgi:hypothetical protein
MKKIAITLLLLMSYVGYSQTNGITYQAVILNPSGEQLPGVNNTNAPLANQNISLKFSIIDHNSQYEYVETVQTTTDEFGMVNLIIGTNVQTGGYASSFSTVLWNANPKRLKVDLSTTELHPFYTEISNQPFTAVPFALYAVNSESTAAIAALQATVAANATATTNALALKEDAINKSNATTLGTSNVLFPTQNAVKTYVDTNISTVNATTLALQATVTSNATATNAALGLKEDASNKSTTTTLGTSNVLFPTQNAVKTYVDNQILSATIADANATTKGKIKLAGDLAGTADAPTVPGLANKENSTNKSTVTTLGNSDVLFPTQNAVKTYVDTNISTVNAATATALALKANTASLATVATSGSYNDLTNRPTIPATYSLPTASASTLGGIKVGTNLSIDSNGVLSGISSYSLPTATASELGGVKVGSGLTITNGILSASGSGVPYTGATQAVDLGAFDLKVNGITVGRGNGNLASNTATGKDALLSNNTIGANNTAMGNQALYSNTFGSQNTAIGSGSLNSNINGIQNTAVGILSLEKNVGVSYNTAVGAEALRFTVDGESNTATGASALRANISGAYNSAFGRNALSKSTVSFNNAAFGAEALSDNLANGNTAYGAYALQRNTTGYSNTAVGLGAMKFQTTGNDNVAIGVNAGLFASNQTTGSNNTAVGAFAEYGAANLTNATVIGSGAIVSTSNTIQLGNTAVTNVKTSGTITAGAVTYPKVDGTAGQVLTANANGIPTWQTIATSPLVSPNFTGTPTAPTATAGTNTTQIATTEFVTGAIATATIPDATTSAKGKVKLAGDLAGTADAPTVPGLASKAPIASPTFTGVVTAPIYASAPQALTDAAIISWNPSNGLNASVTLGGNRTLNFTTTPAVGSYGTLVITQDGSGGRTITLPSALTNKVLGSTSTSSVTLSSAAGAKDILNFYYDGTNCYWNVGQGYGTAATAALTNLASSVSGTLPVANGGTGAATLTGYVKGTGTTAMTANATIPLADVTGAAPIASPTFTGTPAAPTASAGTNTTQIATTEFVTGAIATATIADATTSAKGKIQLAGDLGGTAASPTVPGLALKANASDVTTSLATKEDTSNKSNAALGTSTTLFPTQNAVKTYVDAQVASATIADANATTKGKLQLAGDLGGTAAAPTVPGLALKAPLANPTFTGTVTAPIYASTPQNLTDAATISWNPTNGLNASVTLGGNRTLSFSTAPESGSYGTLVITQDATGGRTLTLPSTTNRVLGSTSTTTIALSTAANAKDILNFYFDGTTYFWNIGQGYGTAATITANNIAGGAAGSIPYQTAAGATGFLARGTDGQILTLASGVPSWAAAPVTGVTSASSPLSITSNALSLGTVPVSSGGTGLTATPTNGQILIGNGTGFSLATLTAGAGITITNSGGSISIAASASAVRPTTDQFSATANQTSFTLTQTPLTNANSLDNVWMFINGVRTNNLAYSVSGTTVTYVPGSNGSYALVAGDRIQFDYLY